MPLLDAFVGGTYKALSPTTAADLAVNVYPETRRAEGSAKTKWLIGTPGRRSVAEASSIICRGLFSQDGLTIAVVGGNVYRFDTSTWVLTLLGTIANNGEPVSMASNGQGGDQIAIVGGNELKIYDTVALTFSAAITLPFSSPVMIAFINGYFLINQRNTPTFWFSALEDGTIWDALDFIARSGTSDNLVGIGVAQDRVWAFGTKTTTLFYDSGDADTPFLPYPGTTTQVGAISPWAIAKRNDVFTWLAQDGTGTPRIVQASGTPNPTTVSTPPIERWLNQCSSLTTCECLPYQQDGHGFTAFTAQTSPDDVKTYVWDEDEQQWHARANWDVISGRFTAWTARGVCQVGGAVFVGDSVTGVISTLDATTYTDNGGALVRDRVMPYAADDNQWIFVDQIELSAQVGLGLVSGQGSAPVADLFISRDAGQTWISAGQGTLGAIGGFAARVIWRRLGRARMDRFLIRVRQSDPVPVAWLGLWLKSSPGTGLL